MVTIVKTSAVLVEMWLVATEGVWLIIRELVVAVTESSVDELRMIVSLVDALLEITDEIGPINALLEEVWLIIDEIVPVDALLEITDEIGSTDVLLEITDEIGPVNTLLEEV